ncbi:MAG: YraN family protein [Lachnospiraceae bacterium]|nr:YraN family protein [Lachnospiraceae bacterium]
MNKRLIGSKEETRAGKFLEDNGCRVIQKNFRCSAGEIDIIFLDKDDTVCFGEVKYRENEEMGFPEEAVDNKKQRIICRVSDHYRAKNGLDESMSFRFDVIAVSPSDIKWIKNAFDYRER